MNHTYRLVWSGDAQRYVPAPETARSRGRSSTCKALVLAAALILPGLAQALSATALPTGAQVVQGQASIAKKGGQMTITQSSDKAILDWKSFNIGKNAAVTFRQHLNTDVALNRVLAGSASQIEGRLTANGQVWLVNPNGIVFGKTSQVDVGGLVASTLGITNEDFLNGNARFTRDGATGSIVNKGKITATGDGQQGGQIALLAPTVSNEGVLTAQLGSVTLAAGEQITLDAGAGGLLQVAVEPATIRTLIRNKQLIVADGGQVLMTGKAADALSASVVANTGTVQANRLAKQDGRILLLGDEHHGEVQAAGTLQAKLVQTSAAKATLNKNLQVNTSGGQWLVDQQNASIGSAEAQAIQTALKTGHVTMAASGTGADQGDVDVNAPISYSSKYRLTLDAVNDVTLNNVVAVKGSGKLAMNHGEQGGIVTPLKKGGGFMGRVDFAKSGDDLLAINGMGYTVIKNVMQLQGMGLYGKYVLGGNINASATKNWNNGEGFSPIGNDDNNFTGTLDGLGHVISSLTINRPMDDYVGLFGYTWGATLRNVGIKGGSVTGYDYVGGLIGQSWASSYGAASTISRVYTSAKVSGYGYIGGLIGYSTVVGGILNISQAYATGAVIGDSYVGGLIGRNWVQDGGRGGGAASISQTYAAGKVSGSSYYIGGLIGDNMAYGKGSINRISNAYATGAVTGTGDYGSGIGGLIGDNSASDRGAVHISQVYATGKVSTSGDSYDMGGLIGSNSAGDRSTVNISQAYAIGKVSSASGYYSNIGGLIGDNSAGNLSTNTISNSFFAKTSSNINGYGIPKTLAELKKSATFSNWNISTQPNSGTVWYIDEGKSTPKLNAFAQQ